IGGEVQRKTAHTGNRAGRGANFGRVIRKRGNIIAVERGGIGELAAGDLHAVTGISREADDRLIQHFALVFYWWNFRERRHSCPNLRHFASTNSLSPDRKSTRLNSSHD